MEQCSPGSIPMSVPTGKLPGVDYGEVWAPTGKVSTLRTMLVFAAVQGHELFVADIKQAFLDGELEGEEVSCYADIVRSGREIR
jgi:hypothetical protein